MKKHAEANHKWSSKFGFIMAAVGSAVGLGNIWRFPYVVSEHGGALFLFVYLIIVVILGFMVMSAELSIGRHAGRSVIDCFRKEKKNWSFIGITSIIICLLIVSYYSVIGGWLTKYLFGYLGGGGFVANHAYGDTFTQFIGSGVMPSLFNFIFLFCSVLVLVFGVKKGIEKVSKVLMPALFAMLIIVAIVSLTMKGASEGVKFFLVPDFTKVQENGGILGVINAAMGQAFFSLSVGIGINCTYGSYLSKETDIPKDSITICGFDTLVAIIAGFAILPAVFAAGIDPGNGGAGLIFITLPAVFTELGVRTMPWFGNIMGFIFFLLVWVAALTSCISLLEVLISSIEQKLHIKRVWSTIIVGVVITITSTLVSYSQNGAFGLGIDLLDLFDKTTVNYLMPLAAISMCMYVVFVWGGKNAAHELTNGKEDKHPKIIAVWKAFVMVICPVMIFSVFIMGLIDSDWSLKVSYISLALALVCIAVAFIAGFIYNKKVAGEPLAPLSECQTLGDCFAKENNVKGIDEIIANDNATIDETNSDDKDKVDSVDTED